MQIIAGALGGQNAAALTDAGEREGALCGEQLDFLFHTHGEEFLDRFQKETDDRLMEKYVCTAKREFFP